jgi:hypothetical protein
MTVAAALTRMAGSAKNSHLDSVRRGELAPVAAASSPED